mgnify:CR=1 FL=1
MSNTEEKMGVSGRLAAAFQSNAITPLLALVALLLGLFAVLVTPREEEPQINVTMANVLIPFPGASSQTVQNMVARPAEQVLSQIQGIEHTYSVARPGVAVLTVQFKVGVPRTEALVRLYDVLNANQDWLPRDLGTLTPIVKPKGIDDVPVLGVTLAYATRWPDDEVLLFGVVPLKVKWMVMLMIALNLIGGMAEGQGGGTAYLAHLGGLAAGWLYLRTASGSGGIDRFKQRVTPATDIPDETPRAIPRSMPRACPGRRCSWAAASRSPQASAAMVTRRLRNVRDGNVRTWPGGSRDASPRSIDCSDAQRSSTQSKPSVTLVIQRFACF